MEGHHCCIGAAWGWVWSWQSLPCESGRRQAWPAWHGWGHFPRRNGGFPWKGLPPKWFFFSWKITSRNGWFRSTPSFQETSKWEILGRWSIFFLLQHLRATRVTTGFRDDDQGCLWEDGLYMAEMGSSLSGNGALPRCFFFVSHRRKLCVGCSR